MNNFNNHKKQRILLKLSGESLKNKQGQGIDFSTLDKLCRRLSELLKNQIQLAVVIGGGNIFRGLEGESQGFDRHYGDMMGMLGTVINGLALKERMENIGIQVELQSGMPIPLIPVDAYNKPKAVHCLDSGGMVIFCGGIGNPYFSTDTTMALRAVQIKADVVFKGTKVDGVYNKDPEQHPDAVKYDVITYDDAMVKNLRIVDQTAFSILREHSITLRVFNLFDQNNIERVLAGEKLGTVVTN